MNTQLNDFDSHLDALGESARQAIPQLESLMKEVAGDNRRHALLHRLHRGLHDFVVLVAEPRTWFQIATERLSAALVVIQTETNTMTMNQAAYFAAGRAIGLLEVGLPADIALTDAPLMRPQKAAKILRAGKAIAGVPTIQVDENAEQILFPWLARLRCRRRRE
jgi:hypothetical protein